MLNEWNHDNTESYEIEESGLKVLLMCCIILQCHYSYGACGLGSDGTDRLVRLVQEMQHGKPSSSEDGTLYGAKITGGGSGGTVCVIGRNCLRSSQQILEVILDQYNHRPVCWTSKVVPISYLNQVVQIGPTTHATLLLLPTVLIKLNDLKNPTT